MLFAGSDDGVYRFPGLGGSDETTAERVLESGRVQRLRTFDGQSGVFAATKTGLFHAPDGDSWTDLDVPEERVYSVGASPSGDALYAGTKPARVYVADLADPPRVDADAVAWRELDGFQDLPSREEWRLPRHENLAQVRDLHFDPAAGNRLVAGVEVGGVHVSDDGGETWEERRGGADENGSDGVDDDVHELRVVGPGEYVAATGFGLFRTSDSGETWTRLDEGYDQRYFRSVASVDGTVYAGGALANSSTWDDPDADPQLFAVREADSGADSDRANRDAEVEPVEFPRSDETVTGMTAVDGDLLVATHRGTVLARREGAWVTVGDLPVTDEQTGRYTPLTQVEG